MPLRFLNPGRKKMFIGHYGVALGLKKVVRLRSPSSTDKSISLGFLFLAVQLVDVLWTVFVLFGIEKVAIVSGLNAANPLDFVYYPFTHSLPPSPSGWTKRRFKKIGARECMPLRGVNFRTS